MRAPRLCRGRHVVPSRTPLVTVPIFSHLPATAFSFVEVLRFEYKDGLRKSDGSPHFLPEPTFTTGC